MKHPLRSAQYNTMSSRRIIFGALTLTLLGLGGCGDPSLSALLPSGRVAEQQLSLIMLSLYIMIFVMVVVFALFTYVLIRFRQRKGDDHIPEQTEGNKILETIWFGVPIVLLIILAVPTVSLTFELAAEYGQSNPDEGEATTIQAIEVAPEELEEGQEDGLRISIVGHTYWWEVEYPDLGIVTAQEVYIPTDERVYIELTSDDVIHSFWAPALAGKQDAVPGYTNPLGLEANRPGVYEGRCAQLCGPAHALMNFQVMALTPEDFEEWVAARQAFEAEAEPQSELAVRGRTVFEENCLACHAVSSDISNPNGPNLAGYANRNMIAGILDHNRDNLTKWLTYPNELKPGVLMPTAEELGLVEEDVEALVEYLLQLDINHEPDIEMKGHNLNIAD